MDIEEVIFLSPGCLIGIKIKMKSMPSSVTHALPVTAKNKKAPNSKRAKCLILLEPAMGFEPATY